MCGFEESHIRQECTVRGWQIMLAYDECVSCGHWKVYMQRHDLLMLLGEFADENLADKYFLKVRSIHNQVDRPKKSSGLSTKVLKIVRVSQAHVHLILLERRRLYIFSWYEIICVSKSGNINRLGAFLNQRQAHGEYWSVVDRAVALSNT